MTQHTHNPTTELGRYNLVGQQKPDYLEAAIDAVENAWIKHIMNVDNETTTPVDWEKTRKHAVECERIARDAYVRWRQETCPHTVTRTYHGGTRYTCYNGEPDDNDYEDVTVCVKCHKLIG